MSEVLMMNEEPIKVPEGILTDGTKQHIERAVALNVPDGAHIAVLAGYDTDTKQLRFGSAIKIGAHWKLVTEGNWGDHVSGTIGIVGVF